MDSTFKIILIGAGNIGSRHAQALMRLEREIELTVFDVSENSLSVCKTRIEEIDRGNHKTLVNCITRFTDLPKKADLAIIATNAEYRLSSLQNLLSNCSPACIILEKFLFSKHEEYQVAELLLDQHKDVLVYVNCVKRMFPAYQFVKEKLDRLNGPLKAIITGNNWGLAGNAVHYLDLFYFLTYSPIKTIGLDNTPFSEIIQSKREGYIELLGTCFARSQQGDQVTISATPGTYDTIECRIEKGGQQFLIVEYGSTIEVFINGEKTVFDYPFQSVLTQKYAEQLLSDGKIALTEYAVSADYHLKFLDATTKFIETKNYVNEWKIT